MSDETTGKGMFGGLIGILLGGPRPGMGVAPDAMRAGLSQADLDAMQASAMQAHRSHYAASQAQTVSSGILAVPQRPSLSITDEEMIWVWASMPAGSVLHVAHGMPLVFVYGDGGATPTAWVELSRIPCLRAVQSWMSIEIQRSEFEAAAKLLSVLAYGQPDALSVVMLEKLP